VQTKKGRRSLGDIFTDTSTAMRTFEGYVKYVWQSSEESIGIMLEVNDSDFRILIDLIKA